MSINCPSCKAEIENVIPKERFDKINEERKQLMEKASKLEEIANNTAGYEEKAKTLENEALKAKKELERYKTSVANGLLDESVIEVAALLYDKLGDDAPSLADWLADLKANPDKAPGILRPHFTQDSSQAVKEAHPTQSQATDIKEPPRAPEKKMPTAVESGGKSVGATSPIYDAARVRDLDLASYKAHREEILKNSL